LQKKIIRIIPYAIARRADMRASTYKFVKGEKTGYENEVTYMKQVTGE
jgi:hypothetical protein